MCWKVIQKKLFNNKIVNLLTLSLTSYFIQNLIAFNLEKDFLSPLF